MQRTIEERGAEAADVEAPSGRAAGIRAVRVAMVTSLYPPSVGGIQSHTHALARALAERGAEVHVVTRPAVGHAARASAGRLHVHRVGAPPGAPRALATLAFVAGALRVVRALRPDVVHAQQLLSPTTVALLARVAEGTPILLNPHACGGIGDVGVLSASRLGRVRLREAVRRADLFVAISARIAEELRAAGVPDARLVAIPNGVDVDRFRPAPPEERAALRRALGLPDAPLVVYTGRLSAEKGVDVLVDAWPRVVARVPGARLWVLGEGAERARLVDAARQGGVAESIALPGPVEDVAPFVRAADAAVLPSRTEGMPIALLEAMACEVPVVATAVGGSAEVLRDGVTGRLVPPERPDRLAEGLVEALEGGAACERARAAREEVVSRYGLHHVAERFLDVYARLRRGGPASERGAQRRWRAPNRTRRVESEVASRT
jgi:glycosyltransferase involved in cell wall biosynthesis